LSLTAKPYDQEDIYDLAIRLYGNINGLSGLIGSVTTLDDPVTIDVSYEPIVFDDFVSKTTPSRKRETIDYAVGENQSIYDLASQLTGSLNGLSEIISYFNNLDDNLQGQTITTTKKADPKLDLFLRKKYVFATAAKLGAANGIIDGAGNFIIDGAGNFIFHND
jgi:hypothetical protein